MYIVHKGIWRSDCDKNNTSWSTGPFRTSRSYSVGIRIGCSKAVSNGATCHSYRANCTFDHFYAWLFVCFLLTPFACDHLDSGQCTFRSINEKRNPDRARLMMLHFELSLIFFSDFNLEVGSLKPLTNNRIQFFCRLICGFQHYLW